MEPQKKALAKIKLQQVLYEIEFSPPVNVQFSAHVPYDSPTPGYPPYPTYHPPTGTEYDT